MANPILAAILSIIIPGVGQIYAGDTKKGLILIVIWIILGIITFKYIFGLIADLILTIYAAYDAYKLAQ